MFILQAITNVSMRKENTSRIEDESAKSIVTYYDDRLAIVDSIASLKAREGKGGVKVDAFIAFMCLKGTASVNVNGETNTLKANDLLICRPNIIMESSFRSADLEFRCICLSPEYMRQMFCFQKPRGTHSRLSRRILSFIWKRTRRRCSANITTSCARS